MAKQNNLKLNGYKGNDTLYGGDGNDKLNGKDGDDILYGEGGHDRLKGGKGDDSLNGGSGDDRLDGGHGIDTGIFSGDIRQYSFTEKSNGHRDHHNQHRDKGGFTPYNNNHYLTIIGQDGTDKVKKLEILQFDNFSVYVDGTTNNNILTESDQLTFDEDTTSASVNVISNDWDFERDGLGYDVTFSMVSLDTADFEGNTAFDAATGDVTFEPDLLAYQYLALGEAKTIEMSYEVSDGENVSTGQLIITIEGRNDAPTVVAALTSSSDEDAASYMIDLLEGAADVDNGATLSVINLTEIDDKGGWNFSQSSLTVNPHYYNYLALDENETLNITYQVSDEHGATVDQSLTITIEGRNDVPTVDHILTSSVSEDDASYTVDLLGGAADVDNGAILSAINVTEADGKGGWSQTNNSIIVDPNHYTHLVEGDVETLNITYQVSDEHGAMVDQSLTITIEGHNDVPTVSAALFSNTSEDDASYTLDLLGGAVDLDNGAVLSAVNVAEADGKGGWSQADNSIVVDPNYYTHLAVGDVETLNITYQVSDEHGAMVDQSLTITIEGNNDAPTVEGALYYATDEHSSAFAVDLLQGASDVDNGATLNAVNIIESGGFGGWSLDGNTVVIDPTAYSYLSDMEIETLTFSYQISDEHGDSVDQSFTVDVEGRINPPELEVLVLDGGEVNEIRFQVTSAPTGPESLTLNFEGLSDGSLVYDSDGNDVTAGVSDFSDSAEFTVVLPEDQDADYPITITSIATDIVTGAQASTSSNFDVAYQYNSNTQTVTFASQNQSMWEADNSTTIGWHEYLPIIGSETEAWTTNLVIVDINFESPDPSDNVVVQGLEDLMDAAKAPRDSAWSSYLSAVSARKSAQSSWNSAYNSWDDSRDWTNLWLGTASKISNLASKSVTLGAKKVAEGAAWLNFQAKDILYQTAKVAYEGAYAVANSVDYDASLFIEVGLYAMVGLQVDFELDLGSVDSNIDFELTDVSQYNETSDTLVITPTATNQTTGDTVAFSTVSPNAQFYAAIVYDVGASIDFAMDGSLTLLGNTIFDLSPNAGDEGIVFSDTVSMTGELVLIDYDTTDPSKPLKVPGVSDFTNDVLSIELNIPTIETEGTAATYSTEYFEEGGLVAVDFTEISNSLFNFLTAELELNPELAAAFGDSPAFDDILKGIWDIVSQGADANGDGVVPIFIFDTTDETTQSFLHINAVADDTSTLNELTGSLGFYVAYGESNDMVRVSLDLDQLAAVIANRSAGNPTDLILNPFHTKWGLDVVLDLASVDAVTQAKIKEYINLTLNFERADLDVHSGFNFKQEFTLSIDDLNYEITMEDGTLYYFALSDADSLTIENASQHDANGDGVIDYSIKITPTAMFSNDTELGMSIAFTLDFLKTSLEAGFKVPGLGVEIGLFGAGLGPLLRVEGEMDFLDVDIYESRFEFDAGEVQLDGGDTTSDDVLIGTDSDDSLYGLGGDDTLKGKQGHDIIDGGDGADTLKGGAGNDTITGGAGNDTITGGDGDDTLTGGDGNDIFVFGPTFGNDTITDFQEGDFIDLSTYGVTDRDDDGVIDTDDITITEEGGNTIITLSVHNKIILEGVLMTNISDEDFIFG